MCGSVQAYDNADNKFRFFVDNGYAMDGDWYEVRCTCLCRRSLVGKQIAYFAATMCWGRIATETSKFRAVTIHFVWRPFVDEPYGFGDLVDDFKRYADDTYSRRSSLSSCVPTLI